MVESKVRQEKFGGCGMIGFFLIFALIGSATFYFVSVRSVWSLIEARTWEPRTCTILTSEVEESRSSDGTTYRVAITYSFEHSAGVHHGDRYNFSFGSTSGYDRKAVIVAAHPPGIEVLCFVEPDDPDKSVIDRSPGLYLLWSLFPLPFMAVGFGGLFFLLRPSRLRKAREVAKNRQARPAQARPATARAADARPATARAADARPAGRPAIRPGESTAPGGGYLALDAKRSPFGKLVGVIFVALFWNGIVSVFLYQAFRGFMDGQGFSWFLAIFMIPFVLVGIGLIVAVFYQFLALFNPRPHLVLQKGYLTTGGQTPMRWWLSGRAARLDGFTIRLEGRESATYRRGTSTSTDHEVFHSEELVAETHLGHERRGTTTLSIPERTMPSFEANNNKIEWRLVVHGDIPRWPDVNEEFSLTVHPGR